MFFNWIAAVNRAKTTEIDKLIRDQINQEQLQKHVDKNSELYKRLHRESGYWGDTKPQMASKANEILSREFYKGGVASILQTESNASFLSTCSSILTAGQPYTKLNAATLIAKARRLIKTITDEGELFSKRKLDMVDGELSNFDKSLVWLDDRGRKTRHQSKPTKFIRSIRSAMPRDERANDVPSGLFMVRFYMTLALWDVVISIEDVIENEKTPHGRRQDLQTLSALITATAILLPEAG